MVGSRNQCPWLWLAGPEEAAGKGRHGGREDGWLQRLKLTACEKSSSQVLHLPSISLLTRQGMSGTTVSPFTSFSFTHTLTCVHKKNVTQIGTHTHTVKYTQSRRRWPLAIFSQFPSFISSWKAVFFQCLWKITEPRPTKGSKTIQKKWINNTMKQNLIKDLHGRFILCRSYTTWPRCISSPGLISRCYTGFVITSLI